MLMTEHPTRAAATLAVCHGQRPQPYRFIHKALRLKMMSVLTQMASADPLDDVERQAALDALEELLAVCESHLGHENDHFHAALRTHDARAVLPFEDDHEDHVSSIATLRRMADSVRDEPDDRQAGFYALYLQMTRFVGENLEHMADEETLLTHALWRAFDDQAILGIEHGLTSTFTPEQSAYYLRWMARGLSVPELVQLLEGARSAAPAPVFEQLCGIVRDEVARERWDRVAGALELDDAGRSAAA